MAYEMRISDWSSDVCSSDLLAPQLAVDVVAQPPEAQPRRHERGDEVGDVEEMQPVLARPPPRGGHDPEQAAVEAHPAFPDLEHLQWIGQVRRQVVEIGRAHV